MMMKNFSLKLAKTVLVLFLGSNTLIANNLYSGMAEAAIPSCVAPDVPSVPQNKDLGVGPVKKVELGPLDKKMINEGKTIYNNQCIICHDLDQNKLGPALKNVAKIRTPEYIMNLLLNSAQMQKENATVIALQKQFNNLPMPDPALNQAKARSVLEYLRSLVQ